MEYFAAPNRGFHCVGMQVIALVCCSSACHWVFVDLFQIR